MKPDERLKYLPIDRRPPLMLAGKAAEYLDRALDQFEQLYADSQDAARVMALVGHPYIMGAPHIRSRPELLFCTAEEIADWYLAAARASEA